MSNNGYYYYTSNTLSNGVRVTKVHIYRNETTTIYYLPKKNMSIVVDSKSLRKGTKVAIYKMPNHNIGDWAKLCRSVINQRRNYVRSPMEEGYNRASLKRCIQRHHNNNARKAKGSKLILQGYSEQLEGSVNIFQTPDNLYIVEVPNDLDTHFRIFGSLLRAKLFAFDLVRELHHVPPKEFFPHPDNDNWQRYPKPKEIDCQYCQFIGVVKLNQIYDIWYCDADLLDLVIANADGNFKARRFDEIIKLGLNIPINQALFQGMELAKKRKQ